MTEYDERIAKVVRTSLGREDHGIFSAMLHMDYGDSGQGVGGYALDDRPVDGDRRRGTAAGLDWIISVCAVFNDCEWEQIKGTTCLVLFEKKADWRPGSAWPKPLGLAPLPTERGERFLFADWAARWFPEEATSELGGR